MTLTRKQDMTQIFSLTLNSYKIKSLIKQESMPDRIVQLFQKANRLKSNGLL